MNRAIPYLWNNHKNLTIENAAEATIIYLPSTEATKKLLAIDKFAESISADSTGFFIWDNAQGQYVKIEKDCYEMLIMSLLFVKTEEE